MPRLSEFYGIVITMYFHDHWPPHFHASYAEHSARLEIGSCKVLSGSLPGRAHVLVRDWAEIHAEELRRNWEIAQSGGPLEPIEPLR